ncbi:multicopper oxidase domain-containing protein [Herpetosiphon llansteffanensis]|uniref:multicopper oxidase domain-containing protein n=1 Tax=Herpetosiphon llansteffanensis TaxID=2094568 RepID=UPI0013DF95A4|nr:multicopper oxidase domain-containing protein [Herpetosiphon llansteffanensis]
MNRRSFTMVVIFSLLLTSIAACGDQASRTSSLSPTASHNPASQAVSHQTSQQTSQAVLEIHAFEMGFKPQNLTVPSAGVYTIKLVNDGVIPHDITLPDGTKISANSNETVTADVTVPAEGLSFICAVPGHEAAGMKGTIQVASANAAVTPTMMDDHSGPAPESNIAADESAPEYILYDAKAPVALEGTVHEIDLVVEEKDMTVAPGYVQHVWTFGGTVPGPVIRVKVGDTVRINLKNPSSNEVPHSIDFHSSEVAWNDEMTSINVGEDKVYEWKANYAGVWMYHCGTTPALHHIANGMYGMVIVEPKEGLPAVDHEVALVQSEWYLGPQGDLVSLEKAASAAPAPEYVVFNGVANQYKDHPIEVKTGGSVRVFVLNAGPSIDSSFHVVGTIFNTVIKEGVQLRPETANGYGSQAVDLAPAQGAIVEFRTAEDGLYPIVTHAFNFVGRGALGLFQAGDGDPKN